VRIRVRDTGPGVPEGSLHRVFERYERLGAEESDVGGTGLGLAISARLVEMMGGSIGVESRPGEGATFWVELERAP
jgi:signal transduction histidine kinase